MEAVYLTFDGATLRREGRRITVWSKREKVRELGTEDLEQLVLMGNATITAAAMDLLLEAGVDTVILSKTGRYRGRIVGGTSSNITLRLAQYRSFTDTREKLRLAQLIVDGKVANQHTTLVRHARRHGMTARMREAIIAMTAARRRALIVETMDEVRGCEGSAAAAYFRVFGELIRAPGFSFERRSRRPPMDPVNALLSFGYTLLMSAVESAVLRVGLDVHLGALHAPEAGRPSLACDLVEEHRYVVDRLVVAAINRGAFRAEDFEWAGEGEPVIVREEALRWFITLFERRLRKPALYAPQQRRREYRDVIEEQVRCLARHVLGQEQYRSVEARG